MSVPATTLAAVMVARGRTELRELPVPPVGPDDGLLLVEAAGVCGSDVGLYDQDAPPRVLGHENVGIVVAAGRIALERWGVAEGDRIALEEYLPCGHCDFCRSSEYRMCVESDGSANPHALRYGSTPVATAPGLWGGYSQLMYLHPRSVAHPVPADLSAVDASLALPLANGFQWTVLEGGVRPGSTVLIIGPGQQGLSCLVAAREAGAAHVAVLGLARDRVRLDIAGKLGADQAVVADAAGLSAVRDTLGGVGFDVVIDAAAGDEQTVAQTLDLTRKAGTVIAPANVRRALAEVDYYKITRKNLTVRGVRGHSYAAVEWALDLIASHRRPLSVMSSMVCGLDEVDTAIRGTGGELATPVVHATVVPNPGGGQ